MPENIEHTVTEGNVDSNELEALFQQVIDSDLFTSSPVSRALLLYLWKNRDEDVSEWAIATEALGRRPDFDPKIDAATRVQIGRLRAKLKDFYDTQNGEIPLTLWIPVGSHHLEFRIAEQDITTAENAEPKLIPEPKRYRLMTVFFVGLSVAAVALAGLLLVRQQRNAARLEPPPAAAFWQSFLGVGKVSNIVIPTPVFFSWESPQLTVRDSTVTDFSKRDNSASLRLLAKKLGEPSLSQTYTAARDVFAAVRILRYLERLGQQVTLVETSRIAIDSFGENNTIFIGIPQTTPHLERFFEKTNFHIDVGSPWLVRNRNPASGETAEYRETNLSNQRRTVPGIIALLETSRQQTRILVIAGRHPQSLASLLVAPEGLRELEAMRRKNGSPDAYEAVVVAEVDGDTVLKAAPVALRSIKLTY